MGFSGGGSNVLLPHTHDGRVSQDGGPLNFSNITQSQSAAGEVFYSDGTALQQLVLGAASDELRVNAGATAPEWYTPAAGASTWTLLYDSALGVAGDIDTGAFAAYDTLEVFANFAINGFPAGGFSAGLKFNSSATSSGQYSFNLNRTDGAGASVTQGTATAHSLNIGGQIGGGTTTWQNLTAQINNQTGQEPLMNFQCLITNGAGNVIPYILSGSGKWTQTGGITSIQLCNGDTGATGASQYFAAGSRLTVMGA